MTDRELVELAARAAECAGLGMWDEKLGCLWDGEGWSFDPLNDDGDALRLANTLRMRIEHHVRYPFVAVFAGEALSRFKAEEPHGTDLDAATRRAIVRAAASIEAGKSGMR